MAIDILMPALSPTMEKGTLAKWLVGIGDRVKAGDLLAEIETDKATMEFEAIDDGVVSELIVSEGSEDVVVGTVIARVATEGETPAPKVSVVEPAAPVSTPIVMPEVHARARTGDETNISPLAARIAEAKGLDLAGIAGTGANGRIIGADLGLLSPAPMTRPVPIATSRKPADVITGPPEGVPYQAIALSGMRKTIARRLTESKQMVPHFYLSVHCNLDPLLKLRQQLNGDLASSGTKLSLNDLLIKALATALGDVPDANVQFGGDTLYRFERVDVSMAVAVPGGLVTPVIRDVGVKSVMRIGTEARELAARARDGALAPEDYQGGTVSISNLGMFAISEMFPVINPPQAMILGVATGEKRPFVVDGEVSTATVMTATASFDHRAIDGAIGAEVLSQFRRLVEAPLAIIA